MLEMINQRNKERLRKVAQLAQLAAVLEVVSEKPGNVSPGHDFKDTSFGDFLAGGIAIGGGIHKVAKNGFEAGTGKIKISDIGIGHAILKSIRDVKKSHRGGNTHLGMVMLMVPISAGAGICISRKEKFKENLQKNVIRVLENSTIQDSINLYKAIDLSEAGGLGRLMVRKLSFYELMKSSLRKDTIAEELSSGMNLLFKFTVPLLEKNYTNLRNLRMATAQTYLELLSRVPDTFIARKTSMKKAKEISAQAREVLRGRISIQKFDQMLRSNGNELNPGTTADLIAAALFIWLLFNPRVFFSA